MNLYNRICKLKRNVPKDQYELMDLSDGNGPFISRWDSSETKPTDEEIRSVDDTLPTWIEAQNKIEKLESQITNRRLREAYKDSTWLDAQEALIATERAKL